MTDTDRLDFLLRFICIDDVGDEFPHPGAVVAQEDLEAALTSDPKADADGRHANICGFGDDLRAVIDRAIELNPSRQKEWDAICAEADAEYSRR